MTRTQRIYSLIVVALSAANLVVVALAIYGARGEARR